MSLWECTEVSSWVQRWVWSDLQLWQTVQKSSCPELLICQGRKIISYKPFKKNFIPGKEVQKSPWKKVWEGVLWQVQGASKEGRREGHQEEMCLAQEKASRWSQLLEKIKLCFYCWNILFNKIKLRLCLDQKTIDHDQTIQLPDDTNYLSLNCRGWRSLSWAKLQPVQQTSLHIKQSHIQYHQHQLWTDLTELY